MTCIHGFTSEHTVTGNFVDWICGPVTPEPTTAETVLATFPELRDTDYGRYLDMLDREAERGLAQFRADMARVQCRHEESLYGRCAACGMTWDEQARQEKVGK